MTVAVDIHMPVRCGGTIEGRVLKALLSQDVAWRFFVDADEDLDLSGEIGELLELIAFDDAEIERVKLRLRAGVKRNRLMASGNSAYIYLADPDVLIPSEPGLIASMLNRLTADAQLGAIGLGYFRNDESHIGAGSMLLRRVDFERLGVIRGAGVYCNCDFIKREFALQGMRSEIFPTTVAHHLRDEPVKADDHKLVPIQPAHTGEIDLDVLRELLATHGERLLISPQKRHE